MDKYKYKYRAVLARLDLDGNLLNDGLWVVVCSNKQRINGFIRGAMRFDDEMHNVTHDELGAEHLDKLDKGEIRGEIV